MNPAAGGDEGPAPGPGAVGHLVHIGYPKTGSNLLRRWFAAHPQLAFAEGGIAGFQKVHQLVQQAAAPVAGIRYRVSSAEGLATPHAFVGAPLVDYAALAALDLPAAQARVCAELAAFFPAARILVVTRGFRAILVSSFSQYARSGGDSDFAGFAAQWRAQGEKVAAGWDYDHLLGLYEAAFPGRVLVLPYELLAADPDLFVRTIEQCLGLAHHPLPAARVNESLSEAELRAYPRAARILARLPGGRAYGLPWLLRGAGSPRRRRLLGLVGGRGPAVPSAAEVPADLVEPFRGRAGRLRGDPLFAPYAAEYLL